jgi:ABC-2 type transport system ATP-binding protein
VRGVSIDVAGGEIFGFLGPNGAGKTTTLRMLTTLLPIDAGSATVSGFDVALGLVNDPAVLFLDEPTTGLDPQSRANLWEHIRGLRDRGTTVFLTTHYPEEADAVCGRLMIMDHGLIVAEGTPRELKQQVAGDAVVISLRQDRQEGERAAASLKQQHYVRELAAEEGQLRLYVDDGGTALPALIRLLDHAGIAARSARPGCAYSRTSTRSTISSLPHASLQRAR